MSASLETYLVKLYLDRDARDAFGTDARAERAPSDPPERAGCAARGAWARVRAWWRRGADVGP